MRHAAVIAGALISLVALAPAPQAAAAPPAQSIGDKAKDAAVKTKDAVVKGAKVVGDKSEDGLSKTGEVMTDSWVTSRVHARFVDEKLLQGSDISVKTDDHVVALTGTVLSRAGRNKATAVARGTEGVRSVVNRLTIGPKKS
jgi:osmotically-inducible protein OsmY